MLHWAIAFLILGMLSAGFAMTAMAFSPLKLQVYGLHKSFGMTVLALGLFELPDITPKDEETFKFLKGAHTAWAFVILGVLALHMAGAFKHHIIDRDETLQRMSFAQLSLTGGLFMALVFGALWAAPVALWGYEEFVKPAPAEHQET